MVGKSPNLKDQWTFTTWNIHGSARPDLEQIAQVLRHTNSDVIAIQEIRWNQARILARKLNMHFSWRRKHFPHTVLVPVTAEGLVIISPHRIKKSRRINLTPTRSINTFRNRIAQTAIIKGPHGNLRVINVHLTPHHDRDQREREASFIAGYLAALGKTTTVITGDMNAAPSERVTSILCGDQLQDAWLFNNSQLGGFTNPAENPIQRLDLILVPIKANNVTFKVPNGGSLWAELSDHLPVTSNFQLA